MQLLKQAMDGRKFPLTLEGLDGAMRELMRSAVLLRLWTNKRKFLNWSLNWAVGHLTTVKWAIATSA